MPEQDDAEPPSSPSPLPPAQQALHRAVDEVFEREQVPLLRRLVDQPSHTAARDDVEAAACLVDEKAQALGMEIERFTDPSGRFADHRVYRTPGAGPDDRSLALVGHIDTVFPRSMGFLTMRRDDGPDGPGTGDIVRGPGVLDMKSGLTCILFALDALRRAEPERYAPQYGGYCAWAVSQGYTASTDPEAWKIVDGKLYLNYSRSVQQKWEQDISGHIAAGDANWPKVLE